MRTPTPDELRALIGEEIFASENGYLTYPSIDVDGNKVRLRTTATGRCTPADKLTALQDSMTDDLRSVLVHQSWSVSSEALGSAIMDLVDAGVLMIESPDDGEPAPYKFWARVRAQDLDM